MPQPIVPWMGGKRRLLPHLLKALPAHHTYVEAFAGGAALLFAKEPARAEVLNDINGDLICLYRCVQHHLEEFVRQFRWSLVSRKMFEWLKLQDVSTLTDIQRGARFYYLLRSCFASKVTSPTFGVDARNPARLNLLRIEEDLSEAHVRLSRVSIECLPWQELLRRYDRTETLFFLDPPYWKLAGYGVAFGLEQYEELASTLASLKGKAILTINDHAEMRRVFGRFRNETLKIKYTTQRHGESEPRSERIYYSW